MAATVEDIQKTVNEIKKRTDIVPETGLILGSGLGAMADSIENAVTIDYSDLFGFKKSTVEGHGNTLVIGELEGKKVVCMKGRYHFYEGFSLFDITYPVRVIQAIGATKLIVTNAAGAVNPFFKPGDLSRVCGKPLTYRDFTQRGYKSHVGRTDANQRF